MSIGIVTVNQTTLVIDTSGMSELPNLEQMGAEDHPTPLKPGVNSLSVGAGAFRVLSNSKVKVTADPTNTTIVISLDKDPPPDGPKLRKVLSAEVFAFFTAITSLGESAPR